uniref:Uncharacterized protein n=1 Tax=Tanacetum cinerariifolium TaxID=118510 RepID=A0A6L2KE48_TANCI|nr:hypothetical protein [Tanacetum cinerariifolium]
MIFDGMVQNVNNKVSKFLMHPRVNSPSFSGRTVPLFDSMLVNQGEGSGTPTEPHHTPSPEAPQSPQHDLSSSIHPPVTTITIPNVIPTDTPTFRQYSRRARIAQSSALPTAVDEPASPLGDDSQGEACPTVSGLEAGQDRANLIKSSTLPHDSTPRVTSLAADEGTQDLEIASLQARIKLLEDKDEGVVEPSGEDATIKGRSLEIGEEVAVDKSTKRGNNDTKELVNVLTSLDAANILTSGVQVVSVPPAVEVATVSVPTGSGMVPTASQIFITASVVTPYVRRKEEELQMLIDSLDRNNETITKYLQEYEQFAEDLSIEERIELINDLGMSLEEIRENFIPLWKKIEDFVPMASKEEGERFKRKGLRLEQNSAKKATGNKEKELWVELKRLYEPDVEDQLWTQTQALMHDPVEWRLYDTCGVHHVLSIVQKIFISTRLQTVQDKEMIKGILSRLAFDSGNLIAEGASSLGEDCWE